MFASILLSVLVVVALVQSEIVGNTITENTSPYCDPELCRTFNGQSFEQTSHIACGNNGSFAGNCRSPELMQMTDRRKNLILDLHNTARNRVAKGSLKGYKSAQSMNMLKWDSELEYLAGLNVATCRFAHDSCRNTQRFAFSGQNIGTIWQSNNFQSYSRRIKYVVGDWFQEYKDADQSFVDHYHKNTKKKIGHFTLLVSDRVQRVGCAAAKFLDKKNIYNFLMTCNYDFNNVNGEPIYKTGKPASKCEHIASARFESLCDWDTDYFDSAESKELALETEPIL